MGTATDTLPTLGEDANAFHLDSAIDIQRHLIAMAGQSRRQLLIFSPNLTHRIYDSDELASSIRRSALDSQKLRVQILVSNPQTCVASGHRLVSLAQQLSSYVEIRRTHDDYRALANDYVLADRTAYIFRKNADQLVAEVDYNAPIETTNYATQFSAIWEASTREQEFLRLHL